MAQSLFAFAVAFALQYAAYVSGVTANPENFKATFGESPRPFEIDVSPEFITETKLKAALTRFVIDIEEPLFADGPTRHNVTTIRDFWVNDYNWFDVQNKLNKQFSQFTTTVHTSGPSNFTDPIPLHFVHHISPRSNAVPLLFVHGWPGSFLEVGNIIEGLINPPSAADPAFHVVAPSIPGFGFSPAPTRPGLNLHETGRAFHSLMLQLGYSRYVIQGGDFGSYVLRCMASEFPSNVISVLSNFWIIPPNANDLARFANGATSLDENTTITNLNNFEDFASGYRFMQQTQPLQSAIATTDSPIGFAMWIYDLMFQAVDKYQWSPEEIITWSMMYYIQGPYGGMRMYKEVQEEGIFQGFGFGANATGFVTQPVAISEFPKDIWFGTPLDWAQREGNVVVRNVHQSGGHFAATEQPAALLSDIRSFWGNRSLSGI